ncbi:MAG: fasciclin domain-containing protein [Pseudomonadota bacterium]
MRNAVLLFSALLFVISCGDGGVRQDEQPGSSQNPQVSEGRDAEADLQPEELRSLRAFVEDEPRLSTLRTTLQSAGLLAELEGESAVTLFAPTNEAFEALLAGAPVTVLTQDGSAETLERILRHHIIPGSFARDAFVQGAQTIKTAAGTDLTITVTGSVIALGTEPSTAIVALPDIAVSNGVVHVIDAVLIPPTE